MVERVSIFKLHFFDCIEFIFLRVIVLMNLSKRSPWNFPNSLETLNWWKIWILFTGKYESTIHFQYPLINCKNYNTNQLSSGISSCFKRYLQLFLFKNYSFYLSHRVKITNHSPVSGFFLVLMHKHLFPILYNHGRVSFNILTFLLIGIEYLLVCLRINFVETTSFRESFPVILFNLWLFL